jgi:hypothetical protein
MTAMVQVHRIILEPCATRFLRRRSPRRQLLRPMRGSQPVALQAR